MRLLPLTSQLRAAPEAFVERVPDGMSRKDAPAVATPAENFGTWARVTPRGRARAGGGGCCAHGVGRERARPARRWETDERRPGCWKGASTSPTIVRLEPRTASAKARVDRLDRARASFASYPRGEVALLEDGGGAGVRGSVITADGRQRSSRASWRAASRTRSRAVCTRTSPTVGPAWWRGGGRFFSRRARSRKSIGAGDPAARKASRCATLAEREHLALRAARPRMG